MSPLAWSLTNSHGRPLYHRGGLSGRDENWVDGTASQGTGQSLVDKIHHLAKVRVAGSNPVFGSKIPGGAHFFNPNLDLPRFGVLQALSTIVVAS